MISVLGLKTEYLVNPLGIDVLVPRFSWQLQSSNRGIRQMAFRIGAASSQARLRAMEFDVWDSGRVASDYSIEIPYGGRVLQSGERVFWRVWVWDEGGEISAPSEIAWFEMGLLSEKDWQGKWLAASGAEEAGDRAAGMKWIWSEGALDADPAMFRFKFHLAELPREAQLLVSGKDELCGVWLNAAQIALPAPVFWGKMSQCPVMLKRGENLICVEVKAATEGFIEPDGGALAALLRVTLSDGTVNRLVTGPGWRARKSAGPGWTEIGYEDSDWQMAELSKARIACEPWPATAAILFKRTFHVDQPVVRARLYATALGAYEAHLNGEVIGNARLAPEISTASHHVFYQCYDVTSLIRHGQNALGVVVADGWYASAFSWRDERYALGEGPRRLLGQLTIEYEDGTRDVIATDEQWYTKPSSILAADIYDGERVDGRLVDTDWATPSESDEGWNAAEIGNAPKIQLVPQISPPIRVIETRKPVGVSEPSPNVFVADFGQNFSGWCRVHASGTRATKIEQRYSEVLLPDGHVDQSNLRGAGARDTYVLRGDPTGEDFEPRFTYHGFRFVQYRGSCELEGVVAHSDLPVTASISIENPLVQKLCQNTMWSQRSNFFGVPTDCPQRDERMGWLGDIQVFLDAACFNMDTDAFIRRFLLEVRAGQSHEGAYPVVAPQPRDFPIMFTAGWSEAGIILPWTLFERYGDTRVIDDNWDAMTRWMRFLSEANPSWLWRNRRGLDLGDWLSVDAVQPADETTPRLLAASAYWAYSAALMAKMAAATGRSAEAALYTDQHSAIERAFISEFVRSDGVVANGSQTSYVLALRFGLVPEHLRLAAAAHLATEISGRGMKLSTGFLGTPYLLDVLSDNGQTNTAIELLLQTDYPSWGYMIRQGATSIWERWNGDVGDVAMNSYNHYALGAVVGFIYRRLAGIAPALPAFRRIEVKPVFDPRIGRVEAEYRSQSGRITTAVDGDAKGLSRLAIMIPANAAAQVHLPGDRHWRESGKLLQAQSDIRFVSDHSREIVVEVGSGDYLFEAYN